MNSWVIALLVKPFAAFVFLVLIAAIKILIERWLPDSRVKRALFKVRGPRPRRQ